MKLFTYSFIIISISMALVQVARPDNISNERGRKEVRESIESEKKSKGKADKETGDIEKISVVGSRIRRLDVEGPSPVHVITREDIEKSGHNSVGHVLRDSTVSPYGGDTSTIDVRGLGAENTLVLVNGNSLPKRGSFYENRASDINAVPLSAVERIEVLTDGASAVYGSEALASVINIVTRKDLNGVGASAKLDITGPVGGDTLNTSLTYGRSFSKGHVNTSFEYIYSTPLFSRDLNYINPRSLKTAESSDNYSTPKIKNTAFEGCEDVDKETGECRQYHGHIDRNGTGHVVSNFSEFSYKIGSELTLKADVVGRYSEKNGYGPSYMRLEFDADEVPSWGLNLKGVRKGDSMTITHRVQSLEQRSIRRKYTLGANVGVEGELDYEDWTWSLNNYIATHRTASTYEIMALINESKQAMKSGPYSLVDNKANDTTSMFHNPVLTTDYLVDTLDLSVDGTLGEVSNATFSMAAGLQFAYHEYKEAASDQILNGNTSGLEGIKGSGHRSQHSAHAEVGAMHSDWLVAQLATRYDHYSDFGSTVNPKLALKVQPMDWLVFRGSMGTGFKAPELANISGGKVEGYLEVKDHPKCKENRGSHQYCSYSRYRIETGGNPRLQEETSFSYNLGIGIQPTSNFNFSVDYWNYRIEDIIVLGVDDILRMQAERNINPEDYGIQIIRDENGSEDIDKIIAFYNNMGISETDGLDFKAHLDWGPSSFNVDYSVVLKDQSKNFKELGFQSSLGDFGQPRYRYTITFDHFLSDAYNFQLKRRTTGGYKGRDEVSHIPRHSQYDVFIKWSQAPSSGELAVGVINVLNSQPKFDGGAISYIDTSLQRGFATYYMGYKSRF